MPAWKYLLGACLVLVIVFLFFSPNADEPTSLESVLTPPAEYAGDFGDFRPVLEFYSGRRVRTPEEWAERRREILDHWNSLLGEWPPVLDHPAIATQGKENLPSTTRYKVMVEVEPDAGSIPGYLVVPNGEGPFPAVIVLGYWPESAVGLKQSRGPLRWYALDLARRGFIALSLGTWGLNHQQPYPYEGIQPLSMLAYMASNARRALAGLPEVDGDRIGIMGHSYGGKWAMFASCLDEEFACAVWSDPGVVFDETRHNVNYWEEWYLGFEPGKSRPEGVPDGSNPRTGAYKVLLEEGLDLHELHALMAPRPFLVSGGVEDPLKRWQALNHTIAVNNLLGYRNRVGMTSRPTHAPTEESNEILYQFFERFLLAPTQ